MYITRSKPLFYVHMYQVRDRDSTEQTRMTVEELYAFLSKEIDGF